MAFKRLPHGYYKQRFKWMREQGLPDDSPYHDSKELVKRFFNNYLVYLKINKIKRKTIVQQMKNSGFKRFTDKVFCHGWQGTKYDLKYSMMCRLCKLVNVDPIAMLNLNYDYNDYKRQTVKVRIK